MAVVKQNSIEKFGKKHFLLGNIIFITGDTFCQRGCKFGMKNKSLNKRMLFKGLLHLKKQYIGSNKLFNKIYDILLTSKRHSKRSNCIRYFFDYEIAWNYSCPFGSISAFGIFHLTEASIEHTMKQFLFSSKSGQWCVPSYLTFAIGFVTIVFLPTLGFGERLLLFGRPDAYNDASPASSNASAASFANWSSQLVFLWND